MAKPTKCPINGETPCAECRWYLIDENQLGNCAFFYIVQDLRRISHNTDNISDWLSMLSGIIDSRICTDLGTIAQNLYSLSSKIGGEIADNISEAAHSIMFASHKEC